MVCVLWVCGDLDVGGWLGNGLVVGYVSSRQQAEVAALHLLLIEIRSLPWALLIALLSPAFVFEMTPTVLILCVAV